MIELKLQINEKEIENNDLFNVFDYPIIFYLANKNDKRNLFINFIILNFRKNKIISINSFLPENIKKIEERVDREKYVIKNTPHCAIEIVSEESFYVFPDRSNFFFYINYKEMIMKLYEPQDFKFGSKEDIIQFGSTFFKNIGSDFCFLALLKNENSINIYKVSLDLSYIKKEYSLEGDASPHVTKYYKGNFFISEGFQTIILQNIENKNKYSFSDYFKYVYDDLYLEYKNKNKKQDEDKNNSFDLENYFFSDNFLNFCNRYGGGFFEICENIKKYKFNVLSGYFTVLNTKNNDIRKYKTTFSAPAHFEIDKKDYFYVSSHNVVFIKNRNSNNPQPHYFGQAAIDKFKFENNKLKKIATFKHNTGYRFISHKLFYYEDKPYICTFGHPNRLFFVNAKNMKLCFYFDVDENIVDKKENLNEFLNSTHIKNYFAGLEISKNGQIIVFSDSKFIYLFSFIEGKIVHKINYRKILNLSKNFYSRTAHIDYLQ